ncbi:MAG: type II secretion system protein M [Oleiphilaceae bacterium]|nr:type II secretion system protein M [Oleiphilaceae bacterium]
MSLPVAQKLVAQYDQLSRRDQKALGLMSVALLLAVLYFAVWRPVTGFHDEALSNHQQAESQLAWVKSNEGKLQRLVESREKTQAGSRIGDSRALMSSVTSSAKASGIALQRFEPSGDNAIRVWLEDVPFSQLAAWLEGLTAEQGIVIDQAALDRSDKPGRVSVRLTLKIRS